MLDLNPPVLYPLKSHRKVISIPSESNKLAELMGIIHGDGGINNAWQIVITVNSVLDYEFATYVKDLLGDLFKMDVSTRKRPGRNALVLVCSSRNLVDFLVSKGAIRGNKIEKEIDIPDWIGKNKSYKKAFVRGLIDTDGCLYIHKHVIKGSPRVQNNIGLCFTNFSKNLIYSVADIFSENDIVPHLTKNEKNIYLYSATAVKKYLDTFGFSNPRITGKFEEWIKIRKGLVE